jgi:hypothetical protein
MHRDDVGPDDSELLGQLFRTPLVVSVEEGNPLAAGFVDATIAGDRFSPGLLARSRGRAGHTNGRFPRSRRSSHR